MYKLMLIIVSSLIIVSGTIGGACAGDLSGCTIEKVGAYPGLSNEPLGRSGFPVFLSYPSWPEASRTRMFYLSYDLGQAGLATILTAMSLEKTVWVRISTPDNSAGGIISIIYVNK